MASDDTTRPTLAADQGGNANKPPDDEQRRKILKVIDEQFDLEILLKLREKQEVEDRIAQADDLLEELSARLANPHSGAMSAPVTPTVGGTDSERSPSRPAMPSSQPVSPVAGRRTGRATAAARLYNNPHSHAPKICYARREDGEFVKLSCPSCGRGDFGNVQGFINHCRLSHKMEFSNHDDAIRSCGALVEEKEVPQDHPSRMRPLAKPSVYSLFQGVHSPSVAVQIPPFSTPARPPKRPRADSYISANGSASSPRTPTVMSDYGDDDIKTVETESNPPTPSNRYSPVLVPTANVKVEEKIPDIAGSDEETSSDEEFTSTLKGGASTVVSNARSDSITDNRVKFLDPGLALRQIGGASDASETSGNTDDKSRFHLKRRIVVGNVCQRLKDPMLVDAPNHTHLWSLYVNAPAYSQHITTFVTHVDVFVFDAEGKTERLQLSWPNLIIKRSGKRSFMAKVKLHFVSPDRNKAIDIPHEIIIDAEQSIDAGHEQVFDVELDRSTVFAESQDMMLDSTDKKSRGKGTGRKARAQMRQEFHNDATRALDGLLRQEVRQLPMTRSGGNKAKVPYTLVNTDKAFLALSLGKRKALEWHRARLLRLRVQEVVTRSPSSEELQTAAQEVTTKDIALWCRSRGYAPTAPVAMPNYLQQSNPVVRCRFCGGSHRGECPLAVDEGSFNSFTTWKPSSEVNSLTPVAKTEVTDSESISNDLLQIAASENDGSFVNSVWNVVKGLPLEGVLEDDPQRNLRGKMVADSFFGMSKQQLEQKVGVSTILSLATRAFLKRLVDASIKGAREQPVKSKDRVLTPLHVYKAATRIEEFDFLTNSGLGNESTQDKQIT